MDGNGPYDVIVVGGGPAGLAGALILGRSRRRVLLLDQGRGRNHRTLAIHGYLTRPAIAPGEFLRLARRDLVAYGIERERGEASGITATENGFLVETTDGRSFRARKVLLSTGVADRLPDLPGATACYGRSLFHCPYCDGWEVRDKALAVLANGPGAPHFAHLIATWSAGVVLFTHGRVLFPPAAAERIEAAGIRIVPTAIAALQHKAGRLQAVRLADGTRIQRDVLFFNNGFSQRSGAAAELGCRFYRSGTVITDRKQRTGVHGFYVAGDAAVGTHFVSVAAAEGAKAAVAINTELLEEDMRR